MKNAILYLFLTAFSLWTTSLQSQNVITYDIDNFWEAYDKIKETEEASQQYQILEDLFLKKGSPGLKAIMQARRYTPKSYIDAIHAYPAFWTSVRANTLKAKELGTQLEEGIQKLKAIYPDLKPAKIYFTIGALKTNGTTMDSLVLIGSELALADEHTISSEFPEKLSHLPSFFQGNPIRDIVFLNLHEYVHTQQKTHGGYDLLSQCFFEGICEFVAAKALNMDSPTPAIAFGYENEQRIKEKFASEMFSPYFYNWIWNDFKNEFKMRDLGYFVGYAIAEKHYEQSKDKKAAIKQLIEFDFNDQDKIEKLVKQIQYFDQSLVDLKSDFEKRRPHVVDILPFSNKREGLKTGVYKVQVNFSQAMDSRFSGFDYGPLGEDHVLSIKEYFGFSEDGKSLTFEIELEAGQHYQVLLTRGFRTKEGIPLKPYLFELKTAEK